MGRRFAGNGGRRGIVKGAAAAGGSSGSVTFTAVSPSTGNVGDTLTLTGTNFAAGQSVQCGGISMGSINVVSSTSITATIPSGVAYETPLDVVVAGNTIASAVTVYQTANIVSNYNFESGFGNFTNWGTSAPTPHTRSTTHAFDYATGADAPGQYSVYRNLPTTSGTDVTGQFSIQSVNFGSAQDRVFSRHYFYLTAAMDGTLKEHLFFPNGNGQLGGFYFQAGNLVFAPIGWPNSGSSEWNSASYAYKSLTSLGLNQWHYIDIDYWRVGDVGGNILTTGTGEPSWKVWIDGTLMTSANSLGGATPPQTGSTGNGYWKNDRVYVGWRNSTQQIGWVEWSGVLNGTPHNTVAADMYIDRISVGTAGRCGP